MPHLENVEYRKNGCHTKPSSTDGNMEILWNGNLSNVCENYIFDESLTGITSLSLENFLYEYL